MSLLTIILSILLPPLAVFLKHGVGTEFLISILLTIVGWLPGVIYAFYVNSK
ncbi:YqaE/Pmp3 family membrane protein [uncultured Winogradskyella sp.]|uniref:YqaE/Pmp3 family membrane protein n=1 Tax=Winogradskyella sp. 4-2091 TaxID=3381659 RepID=UPI0026242421|nr:YqaE/Pmp3 family membrane protein [uncultured Winogradskyella sp.]